MVNIFYIISGFTVGLLVGITGVGGGSLMSPLLILLFGISPTTAVGTDLWFAAITKSAGTIFHHKYGSIDRRIAILLALGSVPSAIVLLIYLNLSGDTFDRSFTTNMLGGVLIATSAAMVFREKVRGYMAGRPTSVSATPALRDAATILCGMLIGVMVTLTSVGAGAFGAVFLIALYPSLSARAIAGTDTAHAVPLTIIGGIGYLFLDEVDLPLLSCLLLGSLPGIAIGTWLCARMDDRYVRILITIVLFAAGTKLLFR